MQQSKSRLARVLLSLTVIAGLAFAFKAQTLFEATSLWNDELRSVEKSFQPSLPFLFDYLSRDVHPPLYYVSLWGVGRLFGYTTAVLRAFSWWSYIAGATFIGLAVWRFRPSTVAVTVAGVAALALPFTVRYSVEGKGYALLFCLLALALWGRIGLVRADRSVSWLYAVAWSAAALTHFYGFGLLLSQVLVDGLRRRMSLFRLGLWALIPPSLWTLSNLRYLLGPGGRGWIEPASPELLVDILKVSMGLDWPLVLGALLGVVVLLLFGGNRKAVAVPGLMADWGVDATFLLLVSTLLVSVFKPSAVDRYYIVVLPASLGFFSSWLGARLQMEDLRSWRGLGISLLLFLVLANFWTVSFRQIVPQLDGVRKSGDFRGLSYAAETLPDKLSWQCRQLNASDLVLREARVIAPVATWRCLDAPLSPGDLLQAVDLVPPGSSVGIAATGRRDAGQLVASIPWSWLKARGFECAWRSRLSSRARLLICQRRP
jgi:mannosyltransferase